jgi:hypothetical protein
MPTIGFTIWKKKICTDALLKDSHAKAELKREGALLKTSALQ